MANKDKINLNEMELDLETLDKISGGLVEIGPNSDVGTSVTITDSQVCPSCGCMEVKDKIPLPKRGLDFCRCKDCGKHYFVRR